MLSDAGSDVADGTNNCLAAATLCARLCRCKIFFSPVASIIWVALSETTQAWSSQNWISICNSLANEQRHNQYIKGEVKLNIKLHLNDSLYTRINKYHIHITKFCVVLKTFPNFEGILHTYKLVLLSLKIGTIYCIYLGGVSLYFC